MSSMWIGIGLIATGIILAGVILILITRKEKEVDGG